jgi:CDP-diacylglycerol---serine O-phosphatidyltransferase
MKTIPNLFTLLNLFFGCCAIVFTLQNGIDHAFDGEGEYFVRFPEQLALASLFIGISAVVDFLDGFVARMFKATSEMGKQLDSLADVVSFGVAPGLIVYQFLRLSLAQQEDGLDASIGWLLPAFIIPCAAAWRLAKFNIDASQQYGFKGMPTPAAGLLIASLPLIYFYGNQSAVNQVLANKWALYGIIVIVTYLMVSNIPLLALKFKDFSLKGNLPKIILLLAAVLGAVLLKWLAVPVVFILYIIVSLAFKNKTT